MSEAPTLVYLYGPPAVGKLTVATELQHRTSFRLFHNHLSVNAVRSVFDFDTVPFNDVIHRTRLDVFETAARNGIDVIFTNNSIWAVPDGRSLFAASPRKRASVSRVRAGALCSSSSGRLSRSSRLASCHRRGRRTESCSTQDA